MIVIIILFIVTVEILENRGLLHPLERSLILNVLSIVVFLFLLYKVLRSHPLEKFSWFAIFSILLVCYFFLTILCFANNYRIIGMTEGIGGIVDDDSGKIITDSSSCFYFSVVTFTTLGYGDLQPIGVARKVAAFEAFVGYLSMGLIIGIVLYLLTHKENGNLHEFSWIHDLHAELEHKKGFLMMKDIRSISIPVIEDHRLDDVWLQAKDFALDSILKRDAPNLLGSIVNIYTDYRKLIERLTEFIKYLHELIGGIIATPFPGALAGIILRDILSNQEYVTQIIEDALSETGVVISEFQKKDLLKILNHIIKVPFDPSNAAIPRDTAVALRNEMHRLIEQIDKVNAHLRMIIEKNTIFDM